MKKLILSFMVTSAVVTAAPAFATINAPVPAGNYITFKGHDWAWAAPCAPFAGNSCGPMDMSYQSTQGWRIAEVADFTGGPVAADFGTADDFKCASAYFDTVWTHCDYSDGEIHAIYNDPLSGYEGNTNVDTWVIRAAANGAVPEPAAWAMMIGGIGLIGAAMRRRATRVSFAG